MSESIHNNEINTNEIDSISEFEGELSPQNKHYIKNQQLIMIHKIVLFVAIFWSLCVILLGLIIDLLWLYLLLGIVIFEGLMLYCGLKFKIYPIKITIYNDYISVITKSINKISNEGCGIDNVSVVKDIGNAYSIKFKGTKSFRYCVCQKDLLTKGSIEEFEKLFCNLIKRKE